VVVAAPTGIEWSATAPDALDAIPHQETGAALTMIWHTWHIGWASTRLLLRASRGCRRAVALRVLLRDRADVHPSRQTGRRVSPLPDAARV